MEYHLLDNGLLMPVNAQKRLRPAYITEQTYEACSLDCRCEHSLMVSASSCHAAWHDLPALGDVLEKFSIILEINIEYLIGTEPAHFPPGKAALGPSSSIHECLPPCNTGVSQNGTLLSSGISSGKSPGTPGPESDGPSERSPRSRKRTSSATTS